MSLGIFVVLIGFGLGARYLYQQKHSSNPTKYSRPINQDDIFALAAKGTLEQLQTAARNGAVFNQVNNGGEAYLNETPLHRAAISNKNPGVITFLVEQGLNVNEKRNDGAIGSFPLSLAVRNGNIQAVKELLQKGANPNSASDYGDVLGEAVNNYDGNADIIKELIRAGANLNSTAHFKGYNVDTGTVLSMAAHNDQPELVDIFLDAKVSANIYTLGNKLPIDYANELPASSKLKNSPAFKRLQAATMDNKRKIEIFRLAEIGSPQELRDAVRRGADFNIKITSPYGEDMPEYDTLKGTSYPYNDTPLHHAVLHNKNIESINFLLSLGLDINACAESEGTDGSGGTPLSCALEKNNINTAIAILNAGANPNAYCGSIRLLEHVSKIAKNDKTSARNIVNRLLKAGLDINTHSVFVEQQAEDDMQAHYEIGYLNATRTSLISAVIDDNPNFVEILLDAGADPNIRDITNKIALDYALELGKTSKLRKSSVFGKLKAATETETGRGVMNQDSVAQLNTLLAQKKVPDYVRDKGRFFYNKAYKGGYVEIKGNKVRLRSQPNTEARIITALDKEDLQKFPIYLGEWTTPKGERWVLAEYNSQPVWIFGTYTSLMEEADYVVLVEAIREAEFEEKYGGGYGPLVKDVQLGMKMSLSELIKWAEKNIGFPCYLTMMDNNEQNQILIKFAQAGSFTVEEATGSFNKHKGKKWNELISSLEKEKFSEVRIGGRSQQYDREFTRLRVNGQKEINWLHFEKEDFGVPLLYPDRQFIQQFMNNYQIPEMAYRNFQESFFGLFESSHYYYSNMIEGWEIKFYPGDGAIPSNEDTIGNALYSLGTGTGFRGIFIKPLK